MSGKLPTGCQVIDMIRISTEEFNKHKIYVAKAGDICYRHKDIFLGCEVTNDINNIVVYSLGHDTTKDLFYAIFNFLLILYEKHGIEYISIYEERQWHVLTKFFVLDDSNKKQHYASIKENQSKLYELMEKYK